MTPVPTPVRHSGCTSIIRQNRENEPEASATEWFTKEQPIAVAEIAIHSETNSGDDFHQRRFVLNSFRR